MLLGCYVDVNGMMGCFGIRVVDGAGGVDLEHRLSRVEASCSRNAMCILPFYHGSPPWVHGVFQNPVCPTSCQILECIPAERGGG